MSPNSPVFLEVDEYEKEPSVRRARSNGYLDFLQDQEKWDRRNEGLQMTRYHDRGYHGATQKRAGGDRLAVPTFEVSPRRPRASSDGRSPYNTDQLSRDFRTVEVRPQHRPDSSADEPFVPEIRHIRGSNHSKTPALQKPKVPPVVIQEHPPTFEATHQNPGKSPGASPRSTSGPPLLQYKYKLLQEKMDNISSACERYSQVEAADPRDSTFAKISEQVKGFSFDLQVWSHISGVQHMATTYIPGDDVAVADAASRIMDRLTDRAVELSEACAKANPKDLKIEVVGKVQDEEAIFNDSKDDLIEHNVTESLGYIIESGLHGIGLQIKSLKRLTRSLQEVTPDAREEVAAVASLVGEAGRYFGSSEALRLYPIDRKFAGRRALEEARHVAAR
ncbi:hypothetical protein CC86DRAFT_445620 [Ophiobolus disseminans]|uniref:Uncharacterized protein n=1 Tax=Ophiobolus disseminans TaxID=1469910 RepID=A0A6A7A557_9PLEO|nr:hypothetical protein CC86DRAFT_445620 [Ophiobolus disseminans]